MDSYNAVFVAHTFLCAIFTTPKKHEYFVLISGRKRSEDDYPRSFVAFKKRTLLRMTMGDAFILPDKKRICKPNTPSVCINNRAILIFYPRASVVRKRTRDDRPISFVAFKLRTLLRMTMEGCSCPSRFKKDLQAKHATCVHPT